MKKNQGSLCPGHRGLVVLVLGGGSCVVPGNMKVADLKGQGGSRQGPSVRWAGGTALARNLHWFCFSLNSKTSVKGNNPLLFAHPALLPTGVHPHSTSGDTHEAEMRPDTCAPVFPEH